jgi:hypothetical protein
MNKQRCQIYIDNFIKAILHNIIRRYLLNYLSSKIVINYKYKALQKVTCKSDLEKMEAYS